MRKWSLDKFRKIPKAGGNHVVVLGLICVWFLCLTWPTLSIGFHLDDISNLYRGWEPSWRELLAANLTPFSTIYRPLGGLYYRAVYSMGGLNPFYFRLITFCLLTLNIGLVFRLARRMFGQTSVGMIGALIFCAHPNMTDLFRNNGTSYDVLCCTFFLLAVLVYDDARQSGRALSWRVAAILTILFVLAENSKEMGLALPFVLGTYEFWFRIAKHRFGQWEYPVLLIGLAVLAVIAARIKAGAGSILHGHPEYVPTFTIDVLSTNTRRALEWLASLKQDSMPQYLAWLILAAAAVVVAVSRNWRIAFAFSAALLSAVPVLFIPWRGLFVFYIPYAFISITLAGLFSEALQRLRARQLRLALTTAVILFICVKQWPIRSRIDGPAEQRVIRHLIWQLERIQKGPPAGGSVLMLNTLHDSEWIPIMLARLRFADKSLWASSMDAGKCEAQRRYDLVVDFARQNNPVVNTNIPGSAYCPAGK